MTKPKQKKDPNEKMAKKILAWLGYASSRKALQSLVKKLGEELRAWVQENPTGKTSSGYLYRQIDMLKTLFGVILQKTPAYKVSSEDLLKLLGSKAHDFFTVNRKGLVAAIDAKKINITMAQLDAITTTTYGKEKVVACIGPVEFVLPEEEEPEED